MSTSLLYHGFGIRGYHHQRTTYERGSVIFKIQQKRQNLRCPNCGSKDLHRRGLFRRTFQHLPIGGKPVFVELDVARVHCRSCDKIRQVKVPLAEVQRTYTRAFARYVLELCRRMTIADVARCPAPQKLIHLL